MAKKKILIVEDDNATARLIQLMLEQLGYSIAGVFSSGEEVIKKISDISPDIVLMDIMLKGDMDGITCAEQIRDHFDIPVVFLSAYEDEDLLQRIKETGPFGYILKPFKKGDLYSTIEIALYRYRMNQRLMASEEKYRRLIELSPDAIVLTDLEGKILMCNERALVLCGCSNKEEIVGKKAFEFITPGDLQFVTENLRKMMRSGVIKNLEYKLVGKDGSTYPAELSASLIKGKNGETGAFLVVVRDITKRKQLEEEINAKGEFLESLIQQSPVPTFVLDDKGILLVVNEAFLKFYAVPDKDLILGLNALTNPDNIKYGVDKYIKEALKGNEIDIPVMEFISPFGNKRVFTKVRMFPIFSRENKLTNVVVLQEDVTEYKKIESKLNLAKKLASVGQLASGLAHNLRNPIAVISSTAQHCIDDLEVSSEYKEAFEVIKRNADSAGQLIYELLHFAGSKQMNIKPANLLSSLEKVHDIIEPEFYQNGISFIKEKLDSEIVAFYDEESIMEVLMNIYFNALQSLKEGGLIRTNLSSSDDGAIIEIEDNGCGIPQENLAKIFDPFFSTKEKGTGLGLSICHRSLESQNGSIIVESKLNQGTIVTLTLPWEPNATK